jgi:hypothetical protein
MWDWLRRLFGRELDDRDPRKVGFSPPIPHKDPLGAVKWMEADDPENPFGVRILNCFSTAMGLLSVTEDARISKQFGQLRQVDGRDHIGKTPPDPVELEWALRYPFEGQSSDGVVHRSGEMEGKWDIYLYEGRLYFARSWTGFLQFCADIQFSDGEAVVTKVVAPREMAELSHSYPLRVVDFLIKSHLYGWRVPHPLPDGMPEDTQPLALHSFSVFGRRAVAGTFADTLSFRDTPFEPAAPNSPA